MPNPRVFLDLSVSGQPANRVVFELFAHNVPKTAENFRCLCTGEKGLSPLSHVPLHFKSSPIHRVIEGFMIQGGDFTKRNGTGGESIYGGKFADERLKGDGSEVDKEGLLVMANKGKNTNGSQFFVTLDKAPHLTGKHVVFGRVVAGMPHIHAIGKLATDDKDKPISPVIITHCGELELRRPQQSKTRSVSPPPRARRVTRSKSPSRNASPARRRDDRSGSDDSEDEEERRRRRKERKREKRERRGREMKEKEETLDELDARLEREENERLEKQRQEEEEKRKRFVEESKRQARDSDGVVYKGRGAMRYLDPESIKAKRVPTNYDTRAPDVRPRKYANRDRGDRDGDRWQRGGDAKPTFDRERAGQRGDLDRYDIKRAPKERGEREGDETGREGRKRDWDDWRVGRAKTSGDGLDYEGGGRGNGARDSPRRRSLTPEAREEKERVRGDVSEGESDMVMDADD